MNAFRSEKFQTWCICLGLFFLLSAVGMYFNFSTKITDYNLALRGQLFLMPPTADENDKYIASIDKQHTIEEQYKAKHRMMFQFIDKRESVFGQILANVPDRVFYELHVDYMLPYFLDADDWVDFKQRSPAFATVYAAFVQDMKAVEYKLPDGHNPPKHALQQMIKDAELTQKIWVGSLLAAGILLLGIYYVLAKKQEVRRA